LNGDCTVSRGCGIIQGDAVAPAAALNPNFSNRQRSLAMPSIHGQGIQAETHPPRHRLSRPERIEIMPAIEKGNNVVTLINVFTVEPDKQKELVAVLIEATQKTMKHLPGFVSASIHRSLDGKKVVNYAQWKSMAAFEAMRKDPKAMPHMQAAASLAKFDPILCEVAEAIGT
jgi:quinol monooxygenase YgiN